MNPCRLPVTTFVQPHRQIPFLPRLLSFRGWLSLFHAVPDINGRSRAPFTILVSRAWIIPSGDCNPCTAPSCSFDGIPPFPLGTCSPLDYVTSSIPPTVTSPQGNSPGFRPPLPTPLAIPALMVVSGPLVDQEQGYTIWNTQTSNYQRGLREGALKLSIHRTDPDSAYFLEYLVLTRLSA